MAADSSATAGEPGTDPGEQSGRTALLDLTRVRMLQGLRPGLPTFFDECVDTFAAQLPTDVAAVRSAVHDDDHDGLVATAHGLKGSAQNLGAAELGRLCLALEEAGARRDRGGASTLVSSLPGLAGVTLVALRHQMSTTAP